MQLHVGYLARKLYVVAFVNSGYRPQGEVGGGGGNFCHEYAWTTVSNSLKIVICTQGGDVY